MAREVTENGPGTMQHHLTLQRRIHLLARSSSEKTRCSSPCFAASSPTAAAFRPQVSASPALEPQNGINSPFVPVSSIDKNVYFA